jgi:phenylacetate-CoA ligase
VSLTQKIYAALPVPMQNLAISAYGYSWQRRRFGGIFEQELRAFKSRENFSPQQWQDYQTVQLRKLLLHAFDTVPFYQHKYKEAGFRRTDFEKFELRDLTSLPFLTKNELREFGTSSLVSTKPDKAGKFFSSSGSTGTPTEILISPRMHQMWSAGFEARIRHWAGLDNTIPRGTIGGRRIITEGNADAPFYRYNFFEKQTYFSAYHISLKNAPNYLEGMRKNGVQYMTGYAVSNFVLAKFIEASGMSAPQLKAVITSSEKLTPEMRNTFANVYQCKTFDSYSGVEDCGLISECEHGRLHISPDLGIFEILGADETPRSAPKGEIACTGLINYDQPLIRYRIGDSIEMSDATMPCPCGRQMPIVKEIMGRVEDVVVGKDGRAMVRFHGLFVRISSIAEAQVIQHELDRFEIKAIVTQPLSAAEIQLIRQRMESQLGPIYLDLTFVDQIPRNRNGKFPAVISHIKSSKP